MSEPIAMNLPATLRRPHAARLLAAAALAAALPLQAADSAPGARANPNGVSWGELAMLPVYCKDANGIVYGDASYNRGPNASYWEGVLGPDFWHVHHYCYALANLRRAGAPGLDANRKKYLLGRVLGDYQYMVRNSKRDFVLLPEILVRIGDVQWMMGNQSESLSAYMDALELKPDYGHGYVRWAETLQSVKLTNKAVEVLEQGLKKAPQSPEVRALYTKLTGRVVEAPPPPPAPASAASSPG